MAGLDHSIVNEPRCAGILLHPTSLPGRTGIGTFGPEADAFIDFLARSGQRLWQVCPLGPTGYGDSPYQCFSAFAGNPLLIGLEQLEVDGLLDRPDLAGSPAVGERVDYGAIIPWKTRLLRKAFDRFADVATPGQRARLAQFEHLNRHWLNDYAMFMALKDANDGRPWTEWDADLRDRTPDALERVAAEQRDRIALSVFLQWLFHTQWFQLRAVARAYGIRIIGDLPIFVAHDSADVWAHRDLFKLDEVGRPTVVAGVPPDYFSATGQLWGNPIYDWDTHRETGFSWWSDVLTSKFSLYDHVRIDHFRGFSAYWEIPAGEETAMNGRWVESPGRELFTVVEERFGRLPVIAEDLGLITDDVVELIDYFGFARMKVLQFAFNADEQNDYLPHNIGRNAVVYTGTHDNDTVVGWLGTVREVDRRFALDYLVSDRTEPAWDFVRGALSSPAQFSVVPVQDLLSLGSEARMNTPGTTGGNWEFRLQPGQLSEEIADRLRSLTTLYGRA
ncbi:MAG: 4-alpha-glucanotransferase [Spirochaetota bacterium]